MILDWPRARAALKDATCLWQDLDGLHREPAPDQPPHTSIVWAWWPAPDARAARLRLDADTVYYADTSWPEDTTPTVAWGSGDHRVAQFTAAPTSPAATVTDRYETTTVDHITFLRPVDR